MNTDTPETDESMWSETNLANSVVTADFARKLERERDEARREAQKWERLYDEATDYLMTFEQSRDNYGETETINATGIRICKEREEARREAESLRDDAFNQCEGEYYKLLPWETLNPTRP